MNAGVVMGGGGVCGAGDGRFLMRAVGGGGVPGMLWGG